MNKIELFPTEIYEFYIPEKMVDSLRAELDEYYDSHKDSSGIRSYFTTYNTNLFRIDSIGPSAELVSKYIETNVTKILKRRAHIDISFMNYMPAGKTHSKHGHAEHGKEIYSLILYMDNIGVTNFYDPRVQTFNYQPHQILAQSGKCVLFPGWLEHDVPPHYDDALRVTVPFNFMMC